MALRITGSVIGEPITSSSSSATGMWLSQEVAALQQDGIWQIAPGFTLTSSAATVNEGASITITLTTTGILNGTAIPYVISGANIFANDSANGVITGNFVIQNNSNTISFAANADLLTEGSEAFTITAGGASTSVTINDTSNAIVNADAQFPYTTLALHGNGTNNSQNNTFLDSSTNNFSITRNGNSTQGTFSPYGGNWSNYFDGTGDVLVGPTSNTVFQLTANGGTGLTVEAWIYPISTSGSKQIASYYNYNDGGAEQGWYFRVLDGQLQAGNANGGTSRIGGSIPVNTWTHVAFVINSGSFYLYVNGVSVGSVTGVGTQNYDSTTLVIGGLKQNGTNTNQVFNGYISNLRTTNTAAYTGAFTPSTTPLTAIAGTSLLTCQDNRLIDDSPNNFTITKAGDVSVQRFSPFSPVITTPTSYSAYFDGTGDNLSLAANASLALGTGDFTIEMWVYNQSTTNRLISYATFGSPILYLNTSNFLLYENYGTGAILTSSIAVPLNTWTHIAVSRASAFTRVFINGVLGASGADTNNWGQNGIYIGTDLATTYMTGSISNLRVVKGTGVYTETFTPSTTPLTAIANTQLLTCQSPTFIDNSTNAFAITATGNPTPTTVNPFGFTNTASEYSTTTFGGSGYFDGTGDYLTTASISSFGTGSFTVEAWIYVTAVPTGGYDVFTTADGSFPAGLMRVFINNSLQPEYFDGTNVATSSVSISLNTWNHIAITRTSGTARVYVNGIQTASVASSNNQTGTTGYIGKTWNNYYYFGYISNLRIVNGTAVYTSNFVPPSQPVTAITNTTLLLNMTNAGIIDNAMMNNLETIADAKISTTQSKYGGTSMFFDGTGDYLSIPSNPILNFGTGDFTLEAWVNPASLAGDWFIISSTGAGGLFFGYRQSSAPQGFGWGQTGVAWDYVVASGTVNTWQHVAVTRSGTSMRLFVNGIQQGSTQTISTSYNLSTTSTTVGSQGSSYLLNGYIDDLRVTKGYARYTSNFTPPTEFANK